MKKKWKKDKGGGKKKKWHWFVHLLHCRCHHSIELTIRSFSLTSSRVQQEEGQGKEEKVEEIQGKEEEEEEEEKEEVEQEEG